MNIENKIGKLILLDTVPSGIGEDKLRYYQERQIPAIFEIDKNNTYLVGIGNKPLLLKRHKVTLYCDLSIIDDNYFSSKYVSEDGNWYLFRYKFKTISDNSKWKDYVTFAISANVVKVKKR